MENNWEVIVKVGAEGGEISLLGLKNERGEWKYRKSINEIDYSELLDEEVDYDPERVVIEIIPTVRIERGVVYTWEEAIEILNDYPWKGLHPLEVHPEFSSQIWREIIKEEDFQYKAKKWMNVCYPDNYEIAELSLLIKESGYTVVLTGAGMSTESGIPDFRSKDGWWKNINPATVATVEALDEKYDLFHEFYSMRINGLEKCHPHEGHQILANWERKGLIHSIATQNVDEFHKIAGNKKVYELHGSINTVRCNDCGTSDSKENFLLNNSCSKCGGKLRPNVVLFGENLPKEDWKMALSDMKKAKLVIIIGTSLLVYPVNKLPSMTKGSVVYINEDINTNNGFNLTIQGKAKEVLLRLDEILS